MSETIPENPPNSNAIAVYRAAALSPGLLGVGIGAYAALPWDAEDASSLQKVGWTHSNTVSPEQLVCDAAGRYSVTAQVTVAGALVALLGVSGIGVRVTVNGAVWIAGTLQGLSLTAGNASTSVHGIRALNAGDVVRVETAIFGVLSAYTPGSASTYAHVSQVA